MNSPDGYKIINLPACTSLAISVGWRNVQPPVRSIFPLRSGQTDPVSPLLLGGVERLIGRRHGLIGA